MNEEITLGVVIREMAKRAIDSEDKEFIVPVKYIYQQLTGCESLPSNEDLVPGGDLHIKQLKSSYVANTVSRMQEIKELDLRSKFSLRYEDFDDEPQYCAILKLVPGAIKVGSRKAADNQKDNQAVKAFKDRLAKVMPDVSGYDGEQMIGAMKAIKAMKEMIEEMN